MLKNNAKVILDKGDFIRKGPWGNYILTEKLTGNYRISLAIGLCEEVEDDCVADLLQFPILNSETDKGNLLWIGMPKDWQKKNPSINDLLAWFGKDS